MAPFPTRTKSRYALFFLSLLIILSLTGCDLFLNQPASTPTTPGSTARDWYAVYFTDPDSPTADTYRGGPDQPLANAIKAAKLGVDVAIYDLNLWSIRDALIAAHNRGVTVRVVTESDNLDSEEIQEIKRAGIPVLGDRREGLMHDKFVVIDRLDVWTGSMNYTTTDAYRNNNNLVHIRSKELAEDYGREFKEMFVDDLFGPDGRADTPYPSIEIGGVQVEVLFSPDDGVAERLLELIHSARESIYIMAYSFTSDDLAQAILDQSKTGVKVAGVFDESQVKSNTGGEWEHLRRAGLDLRMDGNAGLMHHKVIIIDGKIVVTGSYNFSASAEQRNDENLLILHSSEIASQYMVEFERVYEAGQR